MKCPACKSPLIVVERECIEVDWCPDCHGIWFDRGELAILADKAGKTLDPATIGKPVDKHSERRRRCPRCHHRMEKIAPTANEDILLDRCPEHGLWLDAGELQTLMQSLPDGNSGSASVIEFLNETFTSTRETIT